MNGTQLRPPIRHWQTATYVIACLLIAGSWGCHGPANSTRPALAADDPGHRFVRLQSHAVRQTSGGSLTLSHPFHLSPEDWRPILTSIRVQRRPDGFLEPAQQNPAMEAFTSEEVNYLATTLSQTFSIAQPHEWVVFSLTRTSSASLVEYTTGAWYVEGRRLHVILANYRSAVSLPGIRALLHQNPLHSNGRSVYDVVPGEHQLMAQHEDEPVSLFGSTSQELIIDYKTALMAGVGTNSLREGTGSPRTPSAEAPTSPHSIEERLQTLKRLLEQGLITEEDYRAKKRQLLERL